VLFGHGVVRKFHQLLHYEEKCIMMILHYLIKGACYVIITG